MKLTLLLFNKFKLIKKSIMTNDKMQQSRGVLIVMEGLDRSGKSTQTERLTAALNAHGMATELWKYPNRKTKIGELINEYLCKNIELEDHAVHLLFSANRWESLDLMKEKLNAGIHLVLDRYAYSGVAYTAAKTGLDIEWCKQCDVGLPKPDVLVFMDTKGIAIEKREGFGSERYEFVDFQNKVYANFAKLLNLKQNCENQLVLSANDSIENLHGIILQKALDLINSKKVKVDNFNYLW